MKADKEFKFKIADSANEGFTKLHKGCWFKYENKWWYVLKTVNHKEEGYTSVYVKESSAQEAGVGE